MLVLLLRSVGREGWQDVLVGEADPREWVVYCRRWEERCSVGPSVRCVVRVYRENGRVDRVVSMFVVDREIDIFEQVSLRYIIIPCELHAVRSGLAKFIDSRGDLGPQPSGAALCALRLSSRRCLRIYQKLQ